MKKALRFLFLIEPLYTKMKNKLKVPIPSIPKISFRRFSEKLKVHETVGQAPGTLIYTGKKIQEKVNLEIFSYNEKEIQVESFESAEKLDQVYHPERINWINVSGLSNVKLIEQLGEKFNLHSLLLEDVLHVDQRPKSEDFGDYLFFTIKDDQIF